MKYEDMKRYDQRSILMPILIKLLQNLGGKTTRKELRNEIKSSVKEIPEEFIDETRPAKNGGTYRPFDFVFNFGVANLEMAGFIKRPNRGEIILTEKVEPVIVKILMLKEIFTHFLTQCGKNAVQIRKIVIK